MLSGNGRKGLLLFLSLLVVSAASAAPTVGDYSRHLLAPPLSPTSDAPAVRACEINQFIEIRNSDLARVAAEFLKPPAASDLQDQSISAKSLPPVPGALFMALSGFLCVSLVKDRRVWFAALAGLLWVGQTGLTALPHLASHLRSKKQIQQSSPTLIHISELDGSFRLRSDLEGTQYIGLLRHLAGIPDTTMSLPLTVPSLSLRVPIKSGQSVLISRPLQFALVTPLLHPVRIPVNQDSALKNKQLFPFSTSFTFCHLARSPP